MLLLRAIWHGLALPRQFSLMRVFPHALKGAVGLGFDVEAAAEEERKEREARRAAREKEREKEREERLQERRERRWGAGPAKQYVLAFT